MSSRKLVGKWWKRRMKRGDNENRCSCISGIKEKNKSSQQPDRCAIRYAAFPSSKAPEPEPVRAIPCKADQHAISSTATQQQEQWEQFSLLWAKTLWEKISLLSLTEDLCLLYADSLPQLCRPGWDVSITICAGGHSSFLCSSLCSVQT